MNIHTGFSHAVVLAVSLKLNLPSEDWMQDWPLEVADAERIDEFLLSLEKEIDHDQQEAIATLLVASMDDAFSLKRKISQEFLDRIANNISHRVELLNYWALLDAKTSDEIFSITPWIRTLRG